ncbi:MAG TPA: acetyl-CoA carboxylase biotin carboxyl carrier protein subunit [Vicinamibacterales bacterium]
MRFTFEIGDRVRVVTLEPRGDTLAVTLDGTPVDIEAVPVGPGRWSLRLPASGRQHEVTVARVQDGQAFEVTVGDARIPVRRVTGRPGSRRGAAIDGPAVVRAPMPGKVVRVLVTAGDRVDAKQGVVVVEAMKMENELRAPRPGVVREVAVREGASVEAGTTLVIIE